MQCPASRPRAQAMARVWRDGQKRPCTVYRLLTTGAAFYRRGCICASHCRRSCTQPLHHYIARVRAPRHAGREGVPAPAHEGRAGRRHGGAAAPRPSSAANRHVCQEVFPFTFLLGHGSASSLQGRSGLSNGCTLEARCHVQQVAAGGLNWRPCAGRSQAHGQGGGLHARGAAPALQPGREHAVRDGRPAAPRRAGGRLGGARSLRRAHCGGGRDGPHSPGQNMLVHVCPVSSFALQGSATPWLL